MVLQLGNTNYLEAFIQALGRKQASEIGYGCCIFHGRRWLSMVTCDTLGNN